MGLSSGQYLQLILGLGFGFMLFVAAYLVSPKKIMWLLLLLIPFQAIDSAYGTINTALIYMVGFAFVLRGRFERFPLMGVVSFLLLTYLLSLTQIPKGTLRDHGLYMIAIFANVILFFLVYNFVYKEKNYKEIWRILVVINVLFIAACALELFVGKGQLNLFGVSEWAITSRRAAHGRLSGPFFETAMTAEYLGMQVLVCLYALTHKLRSKERLFWLGLLACNLAFMIATGNRGGVVSLVVGLAVFMFLFRKELGVVKIVTWSVSGVFVFALAAFLIVQYTQYNVLFERLEKTEFEGVVPDTREGWFDIWDRIIEKPVLGHGPRLRLHDEKNRRIEGYVPIPYPHNAYLYLIFTLGLLGLAAYLWFFSSIARQYWRAVGNRSPDPFLQGMPRLGLAILILFAVSELRMEMFRFYLSDYQQYIFMLLAAFLALSHIAKQDAPAVEGKEDGQAQPVNDNILRRRRTVNAE